MKTRIANKVVKAIGTDNEQRYRQRTLRKAGHIYCALPTSKEAAEYCNNLFASIPWQDRFAYAMRHNMLDCAFQLLMENDQ